MEEKRGVIAEIIFHNPENGYTIAVVESEEPAEQFTAVGTLPGNVRGRSFVLSGEWKIHPTYGEQFAFSSWREQAPETAAGMESFLSSGVLKGIGPKTAAAIVQKFGKDTFRVIQEEPDRLTEVSGIGPAKAASVAEAFRFHRELAEITLYFQNAGLSAGSAVKLYKEYGADTIKILEENPYRLINDVYGIGFRKADAIASQLGFDKHDPERIRSGILYLLWRYVNEGHTFVPQKMFCEEAANQLEVGSEEIYEALTNLAFEDEIHVEELEGRTVVFLLPYYVAEQQVCRKLLELLRAGLKPMTADTSALIAATEARTGIYLSENQKHAVRSSLNNGVTVITGGPGTGKTTIINTIIEIFQQSGLSVALAAPTGRAAKRMSETSGQYASTIHRLLEYYYSEGEDLMRFGKNYEDPLDYDVVIVDEASMIDILLMKGLLDAIKPGTRLIIVGDADQLPSVGPGNVLRDILDSEIVESLHLTEIFRQARESLIVTNAHRINQGDYPECNEKDKDFFFLRRNGEKEMLETIKDLYIRRLPNFYENCDVLRDLQVLTPVRKGLLGSINLNKELQALLNPPEPGKGEKASGQRIFREGDKVMQIRNNYSQEWKRSEDFLEGTGVFNGDVGIIQTLDEEFHELTILFDDGRFSTYDFTQLDELELAYAITVHKSQGSEFPMVIMPMSWFPPMLSTRNLLYTAVTRARDRVILVGSERKMEAMVDNNRIVERYSGLAVRLKRFLEQG